MTEEMSMGLWRDERERDYNRDLYNSRTHREYHPNLNAPAVQSDEYVAGTIWESHNIPCSENPQLFGPLPDSDPVERPITYEQSKTMSDFFLKAMEVQYQSREMYVEDDPDIVSLETAIRMTGAMPESAGHAADMIADEINQAIDQVTDGRMTQEMELDFFQMQYDPCMIAQHIFDQQMEYMANPLLMPELTEPIQDPMLGF